MTGSRSSGSASPCRLTCSTLSRSPSDTQTGLTCVCAGRVMSLTLLLTAWFYWHRPLRRCLSVLFKHSCHAGDTLLSRSTCSNQTVTGECFDLCSCYHLVPAAGSRRWLFTDSLYCFGLSIDSLLVHCRSYIVKENHKSTSLLYFFTIILGGKTSHCTLHTLKHFHIFLSYLSSQTFLKMI